MPAADAPGDVQTGKIRDGEWPHAQPDPALQKLSAFLCNFADSRE